MRKAIYLDVYLDLLSRIYLNTEIDVEKTSTKSWSSKFSDVLATKNLLLLNLKEFLYLDVSMKNMICMQVIKCHQQLNKPLTKFLYARVHRYQLLDIVLKSLKIGTKIIHQAQIEKELLQE